MLDTLKQLDTEAFLWINSHHNTVLDWILWSLSQHWCWLVVVLAAFGWLTLRTEARKWWIVAICLILCFLLADQGSVHLFKDTVCRLRPCHALDNVRMFRTHCGGSYGFVSSHAANAFAVVTFLILRYRNRGKNIIALTLLAVWAVATCYSRAYLGKHYPGDLLGGALFGALIGLIVWSLSSWLEKKLQKGETK